jgi:hypothetical protein
MIENDIGNTTNYVLIKYMFLMEKPERKETLNKMAFCSDNTPFIDYTASLLLYFGRCACKFVDFCQDTLEFCSLLVFW